MGQCYLPVTTTPPFPNLQLKTIWLNASRRLELALPFLSCSTRHGLRNVMASAYIAHVSRKVLTVARDPEGEDTDGVLRIGFSVLDLVIK